VQQVWTSNTTSGGIYILHKVIYGKEMVITFLTCARPYTVRVKV
jgi:hypothetical protein